VAVRLNKYLADRGVGARRKCDALIAEGRVRVNGEVVTAAGTKVEEQRDRVSVDGKPVAGRSRTVYYVLNKPVGVITTLDDPEGRRTVGELLPRGARVYPVGRLDADTSGLLLLTNDGELAHRLMHPRYGVLKVYRVRLADEPRPDQLRRLAAGVRYEPGRVSAPARVRRVDPGFDAIMIELAIHEGRFRQVRRMCEAVGLQVTGLHRVGYGPLRLGPLARGMFRELSPDEVESLRAAASRPGGSGPRRAPKVRPRSEPPPTRAVLPGRAGVQGGAPRRQAGPPRRPGGRGRAAGPAAVSGRWPGVGPGEARAPGWRRASRPGARRPGPVAKRRTSTGRRPSRG
jgi:23S rRNA pseudouridine2605 synthase